MKKCLPYFAFILITFSCNHYDKHATQNTSSTDSSQNTGIDSAKNTMQVSELSGNELKDDSVFTDGSIPASWKIAGITDVRGLKLFIKQLQQWVVENDKEKLSGVIQYPLDNKYKNPSDVVEHYDKIFTREVKLSLATINFNQLFRNYRGVMTDGGKIWIAQDANQFKIIAINSK